MYRWRKSLINWTLNPETFNNTQFRIQKLLNDQLCDWAKSVVISEINILVSPAISSRVIKINVLFIWGWKSACACKYVGNKGARCVLPYQYITKTAIVFLFFF